MQVRPHILFHCLSSDSNPSLKMLVPPTVTRLTFGVADNDRHGLLPGHQPGEANRVAESAGLADRVETRGAPCVGQRLSRGLRGDLGQEHSFEPGFYGRWAT